MGKRVIDFMCTAFRDGFQSCYGARVLNKDFMPAMEAARDAGIKWFEHGGGAIFQSKVFYCNENPFAAMDEIREKMGPDVKLQTLARGVNVIALDSQPSAFIKLHAETFKKHGVTTIRNFDALNDVNNLIYSGQCIHDAGLEHEVVITMMGLPPGLTGAHDPDFYEGIMRKILAAGIPFNSICFKDASGTTPPAIVHEVVKRARKVFGDDAYLVFHSHCTADGCIHGYMSAIEAGINAVDLSIAPMSGGTAQPDVLTMWHNLRGSDYTLDIDVNKMREAENICKECMSSYFKPPESDRVEPMIPWSPMPGGALTANTQMLRDNNLMNKYEDCIKAMNECVAKGGFGTSVTPVSQFYFQQAFNNAIYGPWKKIAAGYGKMVLGYFGKTPAEPDPEVVKIASEQLKLPVNTRPILEYNDEDESKSYATVKKQLEDNNIPVTDDNLFLVSTCREKGIMFLKGEAKVNIRKNAPKAEPVPAAKAAEAKNDKPIVITLDGESYNVSLEDGKVKVNGKAYNYEIGEAKAQETKASAPAAAPASGTVLKAPLPGLILRIPANVGDKVSAGDTVLVLEAMKMETEIKAPASGTIASINVKQGDQVTTDTVLACIQ